jgi:outer membrane protein assembly factor BamB
MPEKPSNTTTVFEHPQPYYMQGTTQEEREQAIKIKLKKVDNPLPKGTLGDIGLATRVEGQAEFPLTLLIQPFDPRALAGIDATSVRVFRFDNRSRSLQPIWNSAINVGFGFVWAKIRRPGVYVPIGLPRDRLLQEMLREMAQQRRYADAESLEEREAITQRAIEIFLKLPSEDLAELRLLLTTIEAQTGIGPFSPNEIRPGKGGHLLQFPLPRDVSLEEFRERLVKLETPVGGLPEEMLFNPPETLRDQDLPWPSLPNLPMPDKWVDPGVLKNLSIWDKFNMHYWFPWFFSRNWWMYQHDVRHSGHASGLSNIRSTNVGTLIQQSAVPVDGPVITKPSIVHGKIYIGTGKTAGSGGGTLYKINLATGNIEGEFPTSGMAFYSWYQGIGGSPAIVNGKVYFTAVHGKVYCIDALTMTPTPPHPAPLWVTDLKHPDVAYNQPVNNPNADSWSGPLVVDGKVYVGCGEGESATTYGFVYCLDANTGNVIWLFCTSKFANRHGPGSENTQNVIPSSVAISDPLPAWAVAAGFSIQPDPVATRETGCSVWSSCAYDRVLNRIYVGTGNSQYDPVPGGGTTIPDEWYGSGLISLDADTGEFKGFFQPNVDDCYWPGDLDIDVPGAPTIFWHQGTRVVAFGSKNGSFFLLDPDTLAPLARRQLLPRTGGDGTPGNRGTAIPNVVPTGGSGENKWGVMGTPAVHSGLGRLFIGLGGYDGMHLDDVNGIDPTRTPFLRALNWNTLQDAWPTVVGPDGVTRYTTTKPPMYMSLEVALSSPAVVNDVVFVSTNKSGLYALDAAMGHCLWRAPSLPTGAFVLGPSIYGNYVVIGAGSNVYIYTLARELIRYRPPWLIVPWWERLRAWPPPPDPLIEQANRKTLTTDEIG